jgi:hypothetical protein
MKARRSARSLSSVSRIRIGRRILALFTSAELRERSIPELLLLVVPAGVRYRLEFVVSFGN